MSELEDLKPEAYRLYRSKNTLRKTNSLPSAGNLAGVEPAGQKKHITEGIKSQVASSNDLSGSSLEDGTKQKSYPETKDISRLSTVANHREHDHVTGKPSDQSEFAKGAAHELPNTPESQQPSELPGRDGPLAKPITSHPDQVIKSSPESQGQSSTSLSHHVSNEAIVKNSPINEPSSEKVFTSGATPIPEQSAPSISLSPVLDHSNSHVNRQLDPVPTPPIASVELTPLNAGMKKENHNIEELITMGEKSLEEINSSHEPIPGETEGHKVKDTAEGAQPQTTVSEASDRGSSLEDETKRGSDPEKKAASEFPIQASMQPEEQVASQLPGKAHLHQTNGRDSPNTNREPDIEQPSTLLEHLQSHDDPAIKSSPIPGRTSSTDVLPEYTEENSLPESSSGKAFTSGATPNPGQSVPSLSLSPVLDHSSSHVNHQLDPVPTPPITSVELTSLNAGMNKENPNIEELIPMGEKRLEEINSSHEPIPGETGGHKAKDTAEGAQPQTTVSEASDRGSSLEDETKQGSDPEKKAASEFPIQASMQPEPNHVIGQPSDQVNLPKEDGQNSQSIILNSDREKPTIPPARDDLPAEQTLSHDERAFTSAHTATNVSPKKLISEASHPDWFFQEKKESHTLRMTSMSPHRVPKTVDYTVYSFDPEVEMNHHAVYISPNVSFLRRWIIKLYRQWKKLRIFAKKLLPKMTHSRPVEWAKAKWTSIGGWSRWILHQFVWSPDLAQKFQKYTTHSEVYDVYQLDRQIDPLKDLNLGTGNYPGRPYNHIDDLAWLGNQLSLGHDDSLYDYYRLRYSGAFLKSFPEPRDRVRIDNMLRNSIVVGRAQQEWDKAVGDGLRQEQKLLDELGSPEGIDALMRKISRTLHQKPEDTITSSVMDPTQRLKPLYELYKYTVLSEQKSSRKILQELSKKVNAKEFKTIQESIETYAPIKAQLINSLSILNQVKRALVEHFVNIKPGALHRHESESVDSTRLIKYLEGLKKLVKELKEPPESDPKKL
ncbi:hypothetical protein CROQUDRAFT_154684 [Cronartium quercuum f. sp. fusiforme G11]|uniref:Uncharacterized protein n=1 Tax=Cronartium quercuum f. sp. fusiforme G11 TaxID=708437 RepID=A0A9P6NP74_9BASI|nr:hypothetical protein CROQUDRAFT_154684 [Cronartium quercuum f. sp. fusiforme G11]